MKRRDVKKALGLFIKYCGKSLFRERNNGELSEKVKREM